MRRFVTALVVVALVGTGAACGGDDNDGDKTSSGTVGDKVATLAVPSLPAEILGLDVASENVSEALAGLDATFFDRLGLWSLRSRPDEDGSGGNLVQATLQVSRFNDEARPASAEFRNRVVNQIGSTKPKEFRLGKRTVYLTTGTKQSIAVWFADRHLFVLASRADYDTPRTLLRELLGIKP